MNDDGRASAPVPEPRGLGGGHVPDLSEVLLEGERAVFVARGRVRTTWLPRLGRWFVVVTDRRLVCLQDRESPTRQQIYVALPRIEQAFQHGVVRSKVLVKTRRGTLRIGGLGRAAGGELVSWLLGGARSPAARAALPPRRPQAGLPAGEPALDRIEQLESDLARLQEEVTFLEDLLHARHGPPPVARREGG